MATDEGCRLGAPPPISTLALTQLIDTGGAFPQATGPAINSMAMLHTFAGTSPAFGASTCAAQLLTVAGQQALFGAIGVGFGGDGKTSFALPDLGARVVEGGLS